MPPEHTCSGTINLTNLEVLRARGQKDFQLPGEIIGVVRENVYDTATGEHLLLPQGAKLLGAYASAQVFGQQRVLVRWSRVVFPDGKSIRLPNFTGADSAGYGGFHDQVNNHFGRVFGAAVMISVVSTAASLSQENTGRTQAENRVRETLGRSLGEQLSTVATDFLKKFSDVEPTLEIRPGYRFNVLVRRDMIFPGEG